MEELPYNEMSCLTNNTTHSLRVQCHCVKFLIYNIDLISTVTCQVDIIIILQIRKLKFRKVEKPAHAHTTST